MTRRTALGFNSSSIFFGLALTLFDSNRSGIEPGALHWHENALLTFEEFCDLLHIPQRTVRDWRQGGIGPRWARFNGCGRLYITVAKARRFLRVAIAAEDPCGRIETDREETA